MSRTVTALYDTRAEAEAARDRLTAAVDVESRAKIIDKSADEGSSGLGGIHMSHEDRHAYGEGLRRGGFLLCAEVDGDEDADKIVAILEESSSVDFDERQSNWKNEGWQPYSDQTGGTATGQAFSGTGLTSGSDNLTSGTQGRVVEEEHIPIVEEQLLVGKREVSRGGARVRSYVREVPVHEQVNLREEHVSVERRPVSGSTTTTANLADGAFQDRTIEMTETAEVPMVSKEAHVAEEVVVRKTAEEHLESVDDTVRRTEVEVDEGARAGSDRSAFSGFGDRNADNQSTQSSADFENSKRDI